MNAFALLAPVVLVAAMVLLLAYARRHFRPKPRDDRDLATHLGMTDSSGWAPGRKSDRTHASDGAMDGGDGASAGDGGGGGGDGGGGD
ncbi:MAG: hypothetical protein FJ207_03365 [Gemmatimonadetes bacterium]|nr:hypothetical protein [Gemmatimonadota bacterium]